MNYKLLEWLEAHKEALEAIDLDKLQAVVACDICELEIHASLDRIPILKARCGGRFLCSACECCVNISREGAN